MLFNTLLLNIFGNCYVAAETAEHNAVKYFCKTLHKACITTLHITNI